MANTPDPEALKRGLRFLLRVGLRYEELLAAITVHAGHVVHFEKMGPHYITLECEDCEESAAIEIPGVGGR